MDQHGFRLTRAPDTTESPEVHLDLSGILDSHGATHLADVLDAEVQAGRGVRSLLLDLAGLNYASSTGIGALITSTQRLRCVGVDLILVDTPPHIQHIVDLLGFSPSLDFR